jgi:hypothetical protein
MADFICQHCKKDMKDIEELLGHKCPERENFFHSLVGTLNEKKKRVRKPFIFR